MDISVVTYLDPDDGTQLIGVFDADDRHSDHECLEVLKEDWRMANDLEGVTSMEEAIIMVERLNFTVVKLGEHVWVDL